MSATVAMASCAATKPRFCPSLGAKMKRPSSGTIANGASATIENLVERANPALRPTYSA